MAIQQVLRGRLSSYKVPKLLSVVSADEVPTVAAGKVAKRELAAMLRRKAGVT